MKTEMPQISAHISMSTKELVDEYVKQHGVKKAHLIETAILHHLQALQEVPIDVIIPPKIVISQRSGNQVLKKLEESPNPTPTMKKLFNHD